MKKTLLFAFIATILIITLACNFSNITSSTGPTDQPALINFTPTISVANTPTETTLPTATVTPVVPEFENQLIEETSQDPLYTIKVSYPYLTNTDDVQFNQMINEMIDPQIQDFNQAVSENEEWRKENVPEIGNDFYIQYEITYSDANLISVYFIISQFIAGSAHPFSFSLVENYDLQQAKDLQMSDLFTADSDYLPFISEYCKGQLQSEDYDFFEEGFDPSNPDNYRNWNLSPENLLVTFDPYQVAAYAVGFLKCTIPYSEIQDRLNMDGPVGYFYK